MKKNIFKRILKSCGITFHSKECTGVADLLQGVEWDHNMGGDQPEDNQPLSGACLADTFMSNPWLHAPITLPKVNASIPKLDTIDIIDADPLTSPLGQGKYHGFNYATPKRTKIVVEKCLEESYL